MIYLAYYVSKAIRSYIICLEPKISFPKMQLEPFFCYEIQSLLQLFFFLFEIQ